MIDPLISAIITVISWIVGVIANIAGVFSRLSYYASKIPFVGSYLANLFTSIQAFFNTLGYDVANFGTKVQNVLNAIDDWLDKLAALWSAVYGWISDKLDDAYTWAQQASPSNIFAWLMNYLGIYKKSGESWIKAIARVINTYLPDIDIPTFSEIFAWLMNHLGIYKLSGETWWQAITRKILESIPVVDIPTFDEIFAWIMNHLGIYKLSGESWWQAFTRTIAETLAVIHIPGLGDMIVEVFGIQKQSGESSWDAIIRTIITSIPGLAGVVNFWSLWWSALNGFFNDPWGWLVDKFTDWFLGPEQ